MKYSDLELCKNLVMNETIEKGQEVSFGIFSSWKS